MTRFPTIVADPPWTYRSRDPFASGSWARTPDEGERRSPVAASEQYPTLALEDICAIPVESFAADDAYLWLWIPAEHFEERAHRRVIEAWGFEYRAWRVWGKTGLGVGYWLRGCHEVLVLATRGRPGPLANRSLPSWFQTDRTRHSEKPDVVYREIEDACPGPYLELFGRRERPLQLDAMRETVRWTVWGNEVGDPLGIGFDPEKWRDVA